MNLKKPNQPNFLVAQKKKEQMRFLLDQILVSIPSS